MRGHPGTIGGAAMLTLLGGCGGGSGGNLAPGQGPPAFSSVPQVRVSQPATFGACTGVTQPGTLYGGTAVEPSFVVNPTNSANLIAAWQQERWSTGGAQALNLGVSFDGGMSWVVTNADFSVCTGGTTQNMGNYLRASDPWLTVSPTGLVYALSLSFTGGALLAGSSNAQLVARSIDGGSTWSAPIALIADGSSFFNDKGSITADPNDPGYVYAVWDRLSTPSAGASYFAVTADTGNKWQTARSIYDPGPTNQTIGNIIVVLPGDILLDIFTELDTASDGTVSAALRTISSIDHGTTWSTPLTINTVQAVGTVDPQTGKPVRDSSDLFSASVSPKNGTVYVVWQDSRFSAGQHDGIALSYSSDGGQTWASPVQVNADRSAPAFTPTVNVRADGVIGVSYYDLRHDTVVGEILTDCWLVTSSDASTFHEVHLSGPFDLQRASQAESGPNNTPGYFLGDYQALMSNGGAFLPLYAQTNAGSQTSSDVFIAFPPATAAAAAAQPVAGAARAFRAAASPAAMPLAPAARQRVMERIRRTQAGRLPQAP